MMEIAHGDGAQAWVANVYAEHAFWIALIPEPAQQEVWGKNPATFVSSSISQVGQTVERTADGCVVSGRWPFASGAHHAEWTVIGELVPEPGGGARYHFLLVPMSDLSIVDDWHTMGLAGTGSMSVAAERVFVPSHRMLSNAEVLAGDTPGARINPNPIYRMPVFGFSGLGLASIPVGIAEAMTLEFGQSIGERGTHGRAAATVPNLLARVSEASAEAHAARLLVLDAARLNTAKLRGGGRLDRADAARTLRNGAYACLLSRRAAARLFEATGGHGIHLGGFMQRGFRDIHAAAAHRGLSWDSATVNFGKLISGLPLEPAPFS
jgi:3-hydroxy-9,10-secoandrosta-1,3,5(10)-triene-9,17-dione monooxygenase